MRKPRKFEAKKLYLCTWCRKLRSVRRNITCFTCAKKVMAMVREAPSEPTFPVYKPVFGLTDFVGREDFEDISDPLEMCDLGVV